MQFLVPIGFVFLIIWVIQEYGQTILMWTGIALGAAIVLFIVFKIIDRFDRKAREATAEREGHLYDTGPSQILEREARFYDGIVTKSRKVVRDHIDELSRQYLLLNRTDRYGITDSAAWDKEWDYFLERLIFPKLTEGERIELRLRNGKWLANLNEDLIQIIAGAAGVRREIGVSALQDGQTPIEFENACKDLLYDAGWTAFTTKASGDQGADIIATKNGVRFVIQCKLYSKPVGNKAVQEAFSAQTHYKCHHAAVVSNQSYTPSCQQLADSTGVLLLHFSDLAKLDTLMQKKSA